jgi:hypothetical protein
MHTSFVLLGFDNGEPDIWFYLTPEISLADFMRSPPDEPSIVV